ncbi:hypothetical protein BpHYR1_050573 [Brachionus plicatilis]|uniref:Uncharacterized protein n=1 Tax=Brachionus plicatilis TaxID=10195 RepID=A0A3M7PTH6_BRAPC|nr:hypothetical protein BpHYR1_050573 [Brachionus plicatilis]
MENETQSHESVLMNSTDETLDDFENFSGKNILIYKDLKKRGTNIEFEFHSSYENYDEFLIRISDGDIKARICNSKNKTKINIDITADFCLKVVKQPYIYKQHKIERSFKSPRARKRATRQTYKSLGVKADGIIKQFVGGAVSLG